MSPPHVARKRRPIVGPHPKPWPSTPTAQLRATPADKLVVMCGRFVSASPPSHIAAYFGAFLPETLLAPQYNAAPTDEVYGVVSTPAGRRLDVFRWGLVPWWSKDSKGAARMINARAESLADKPAFEKLLRTTRCIVPADGFYEWTTEPGVLNEKGKPAKLPYFIRRTDGEPLAFAGLWTTWRDPSQPSNYRLHSATIITTAANGTMARIHDRMPAILPSTAWQQWLDPTNDDVESLVGLLTPAPDALLKLFRVSPEVNGSRANGPHLIESLR